MLTVLLWTALAVNAAPKADMEESWEGKLQVEFVQATNKNGRAKRSGAAHDVTLTFTRTGKKIEGTWTEDDRSLEIEGTLQRNRLQFRPVKALEGKWNDDVIKNTVFSATIKKDAMQGTLGGVGKGRARAGQFELKKKKPSDAQDK